MKYIIFFCTLLTFIYIFSSCISNIHDDDSSNKVIIYLYNEEGIKKSEVEKIFSKLFRKDNGSTNIIEIVIYGYSSGKMIFQYSGNKSDEIKRDLYHGVIEALVKIKKRGELEKIYFLEASGKSKKDIIENLAIKTKMLLNQQNY